jgi:hypothetical protein
MASEGSRKAAIPTKEEFDVIQNRIALALAQREALVKSWTAKSSRAGEPEKTDAELEEEDAILFRPEPPYLGVGAPIPSHFLVSDAERNNKSLRAKFFPKGGLKGSKTRDAEEKAVSAKRGLNAESSDEEEGRSSLGKAKKQKRATSSTAAIEVKQEIKDEVKLKDKDEAKPTDQSRVSGISKGFKHLSHFLFPGRWQCLQVHRKKEQSRLGIKNQCLKKQQNRRQTPTTPEALTIRPKSDLSLKKKSKHRRRDRSKKRGERN